MSCGDDDPEPASPTTVADSASTIAEVPIDGDSLTWSTVEVAPPGASVSDVVAGGPGLVAVGSVAEGDVENAAIWTSSDGLSWSQVPYDEQVFGTGDPLSGVSTGGPGLVAVGGPRVLSSADGVTWSAAAEGPFDVIDDSLRDAVEGGPGLVAFGETNGDAALWNSPDGLAWSRVSDDEEIFADSVIAEVTEGGPGLVAVGRDRSSPAIWTSPDGLTWSKVDYDEAVFGPPDTLEIADVIAAGPGLVAVGYGNPAPDEEGLLAVVWTSPDGVTWSRVPHDEAIFGGDPVVGMFGVDTLDGKLFAVGASLADGDNWTPVVWSSPDGEAWSRLPSGADDLVGAEAGWGFFGPPWGSVVTYGNSLVLLPGEPAVLTVATPPNS